MPVWALVVADVLLILLVIGGWFVYRIAADYTTPDISEAVSDARAELEAQNPTPKPVAAPEETPALEEEPEPDDRTEWQIRFAEHFTPEVVITEDSYTSPNVSITITHHEVSEGNVIINYHLADIYIGNVDCFQSVLAKYPPTFPMYAPMRKMMEDRDAVLAVNGDFCGISYGGVIVRDGVIYSKHNSGIDLCALYRDGRMETYTGREFNLNSAVADDVFQVWTFGPALLNKDGTPREIPWTSMPNRHISGRNPRTAIGYFEPGHYCFMVVDGRQEGYSKGATLNEMAQWFSEMGCMAAFNLDGGGSSMMAFDGEIISQVSSANPRRLSDCICIVDVSPDMAMTDGATDAEVADEE